jgi:hypothetical protein
MSLTISYFFKSDKGFEELTSLFSKVIGLSFVPEYSGPNELFCRFLGMEFSFEQEHNLCNDRELRLEDYPYLLELRTPWSDSDLRPIKLESMVCIAFALHRKLDIHSGLLVYNVCSRLAEYTLRENHWFDLVSYSSVEFPSHIRTLQDTIRSF